MLTEKQKDDIGNGRYHIGEGVAALEVEIKLPTKSKENNMSEPKMVTIPETQDLNFRLDQDTDEKMVFFSIEAIDRAVRENRLPVKAAQKLKEVLRQPGEIAAVLEWRGMEDYESRSRIRMVLDGHDGSGRRFHC